MGLQARTVYAVLARWITCQVLYPLKKNSLQFSSTNDPLLILMKA